MNAETLCPLATVEALNPAMSQIKCSLRHSQETPFFQAVLKINGQPFEISNDGQGGENRYRPYISTELMEGLNRLAAVNLPLITECGGCKIDPPMTQTFEVWTFACAIESAEQRLKKSHVFTLLPA